MQGGGSGQRGVLLGQGQTGGEPQMVVVWAASFLHNGAIL